MTVISNFYRGNTLVKTEYYADYLEAEFKITEELKIMHYDKVEIVEKDENRN
jgi:hypothetical protein